MSCQPPALATPPLRQNSQPHQPHKETNHHSRRSSEDGRVEYNDPEKKRYPLKMDVGKFEERLWKENGPFGDAVLYKKRRPPPKPLPVPPGH